MARKRKGVAINGWLVIDKPAGMTSSAVVGRVRRAMNAQKVGHGGTLDPLATGLLPLAFGEATKTVSYIMDGLKEYRFTVRWGEARDTDDAEGRVTAESPHRPGKREIEAALGGYEGQIEQVPPAYSAVKIGGKRAYVLAREDKPVELAARRVWVEQFRLLSADGADHAEFEVTCGKGTYMRALARDLAVTLGTFGHITSLRRTRIGPFTEADAISLDYIDEIAHSAAAAEILRPVETVLDDIPALALTEIEARRLKNGQPISALEVARRTPFTDIRQGVVFCALAGGKPVALAKLEGGEIRPVRVLNL